MKKIIPFIKDINFETKISDITSISLEHNLNMENDDSIVGNFIISGKYKINNISINEEVFEEILPFDITLDDKYDSTKIKIDIDDFYYEIIDENFLRVHIDVLVDNLFYIKKEEVKQNDTINIKKEFDLLDSTEEERGEKNMIIEDAKAENKSDIKEIAQEPAIDLSKSFLSEKEEYVTYKVHIVRETETVEDIINIYNISKEELEKYNTLSDITLGSKVIIPTINE